MNMRKLNEHPANGARVILYFKDTERNINGNHDGIWNGTEWLFRKVYTKDEFEPIPAHTELIGWEPWDHVPYSK